MTQLTIIKQEQILGKDFKMYGDTNNPLFRAKDIATWIEYDTTKLGQMLVNVDEDEKGHYNVVTDGGVQNTWFLTENGLYEVLMLSRKPIAKEFKKQVKQILKQMRLTGGAVVQDREEEFINNYFPSFSEDIKLAMVQDLRRQNLQQKQLIEQQQPYVELAKKRLDKNGLLSITDTTQTFELKRGKITTWAKNNGYLHKTLCEVNEKGKKYFRVYDAKGFKCIGVTEEGLKFINENIPDIK